MAEGDFSYLAKCFEDRTVLGSAQLLQSSGQIRIVCVYFKISTVNQMDKKIPQQITSVRTIIRALKIYFKRVIFHLRENNRLECSISGKNS